MDSAFSAHLYSILCCFKIAWGSACPSTKARTVLEGTWGTWYSWKQDSLAGGSPFSPNLGSEDQLFLFILSVRKPRGEFVAQLLKHAAYNHKHFSEQSFPPTWIFLLFCSYIFAYISRIFVLYLKYTFETRKDLNALHFFSDILNLPAVKSEGNRAGYVDFSKCWHEDQTVSDWFLNQ